MKILHSIGEVQDRSLHLLAKSMESIPIRTTTSELLIVLQPFSITSLLDPVEVFLNWTPCLPSIVISLTEDIGKNVTSTWWVIWRHICQTKTAFKNEQKKNPYVIAVEQKPSRFVEVDVSDSNVGDDVDASRQNVSSSQ